MAGTTADSTGTFGRVSRLRGLVFENLTRVASYVGVVALVVIVGYTALDAFQPFTADPAWYGIFGATLGLPGLLLAAYCWRNRAAGTVGIRALAATTVGLTVAAVFVLWLGGQLAVLVLGLVVLPFGGAVATLARRRRALTVGFQALGIVVAGGGLASIVTFFAGTQATLVHVVALGVPAVLLVRFLAPRPAARSVGATATGVAALGFVAAVVAVEVATAFFDVPLGTTALGVYATGAVLGVLAYAGHVLYHDDEGYVGLFAPFFLLAGFLAAALFHRTYVITAPIWPFLYGLTAALPALVFAARVVRGRGEGRYGVALPLVPAVGVVVALFLHGRYVLTGPNVLLAFGLALVGTVGAYAAYVLWRDRPGTSGLLAPLVLGAGLAAGVASTRMQDVAGPDSWLDLGFLTRASHHQPELVGIHPALIGSLYLMFIVVMVAFPVGVGAAIYLEEYVPDSRWARFLEVNISNLAGVPSVVYGLLGVGVFIRYGGLSKGAIVAGGFTLSLLILPIVIITSQEAIRAVPDSLRQASYGLGATRWQTIRQVVLPRAIPGILTGTILSLGRAVGETAPLLMVGLAAIGGLPDSLTGQGMAMPLSVFSWARDANPLFRSNLAAAGSMVLLVVLLGMNAVAIVIRNKYQRER